VKARNLDYMFFVLSGIPLLFLKNIFSLNWNFASG